MTEIRRPLYNSRWFGQVLRRLVAEFQLRSLEFYTGKDVAHQIRLIGSEVDFALLPYEAFTVHSIARSQSKLPGEMAEAGVYQGGSAKLICHAKNATRLHLFDTFEGLPEVSDRDTRFGKRFWTRNQFGNTSEESVRAYLRDYPEVHVHKGQFPATAGPVTDTRFSFVHLDVDLYESTLECLKFFYPRLVAGGVLLTHDYHTDGVRAAFDEFLIGKVVPIIALNGSQCLVVNTPQLARP